jgi:hypothetical protein
MWFLVALFVAGFLLTAFLSPKMKVENAKAAGLDDFSFPRADEGDPVGRVYGTLKLLSPNTIGLTGFRTVAIKKKVKTGLFTKKKVITGYKYYATVDLSWCLGPGVVYRRIWFGENLVWSGCLYTSNCYNEITINLPELYGGSKDGSRGGIGGTVALYCGSFNQARDPYLATKLDANVPAYIGVAHAVFRDFWWGNQSSIDSVSAEVAYFPKRLTGDSGASVAIMPNGFDANPIEILYDIFVDDWGNLGYPTGEINSASWIAHAQTLFDEANGMSLSIANATEAKDAVKQILRQINGIIYEDASTGLVELTLLRNNYNSEDLDILDPSDIQEIRNYSKKLWNETNNTVRIKYTDRAAGYITGKVAIAKDFALLRYQGKQRPVEVEMPGIFNADLANAIAARELSNLNVPLFTGEFVMKRRTSIKPGSLFVLEWPEYGITQMVMRVRKVGLGELKDGKTVISATQDEFSTDATVISAPVPGGYTPAVYSPIDIAVLKIIELPAYLDYNAGLGTRDGYTRLMAFAVQPSTASIGYDAYINDTPEDAEVLTTAPYSNSAQLDANIERFDGFATGVIPEIDIFGVTNETLLIAAPDVRYGGGMFLINNELFSYTSRVDNGGGNYTLEDVSRAMLDSGWEAHTAGDRLFFLQGQEGFYEGDVLPNVSLETYLIDRTTSGSSLEADAIVTTLTPVGRVERVIAPDYITVNGTRTLNQQFISTDVITVTARPRNRNDTTTLWLEDDAAGVAESGTLYDIYYEKLGVETLMLADQALPITLPLSATMVGTTSILNLYAKKDGLLSLAASSIPILVLLPETLTIDNIAVTIDGETVEL